MSVNDATPARAVIIGERVLDLDCHALAAQPAPISPASPPHPVSPSNLLQRR